MSESVLLTHFGKESGGKSPPVCEEGALRDFSMFKNHMFDLKPHHSRGLQTKYCLKKRCGQSSQT
ncbi:hypothetical protein DPMN_045024 [Dreissena polymorpha]|uniref:Uncharacterized protein n=1 Tax=Dreissena polymorpha TaxID=45954 RepID=A0A9D4D3C1_DREPO|nr:hypothetical protein DPMN_045024 [Dreissena polymorpha]